jgi:NAD(P)-dependent dehydrogenase (short-subunit alcohol dehydrogenase family)
MPKFDVVVTGGNGFLGRQLADFLTAKGITVAILDSTAGHDLTDEEFVKDWFRENLAQSLINLFAINDHVGKEVRSPTFLDMSLENFSNTLEVNVVALFSVCREFIRNNEFGSIVNFSSIYSVVSPRTDMYGVGEKDAAYGISKAAVNQLTRHLATHAAPKFRVNSIILGGIEHDQTNEFKALYSKNVPLGRMGHAGDIFSITYFLISNESSYCTGAQFVIDGGWTAW